MQTLRPEIQQRIDTWLAGNYDQKTKNTIQDLLDNKAYDELTDAFYKDLDFGTGGLRGIMGPGSNRVNVYTIGMATQGLANFLTKTYPGEKIKVAIAHDSRIKSPLFAQTAAGVLSANGFTVYSFDALRPTPELSFAIRELGCHSGVMVTASHNPKEYNGYKVYGSNGGQVVAPHDANIIQEVRAIDSIDQVKFAAIEENIVTIGSEMDEKYLSELCKLSISQEEIKHQSDLKIVFSPIHGTGSPMVPDALKRFGFDNVQVVEEQAMPDGNFPTVIYPNPEEEEALSMALAKGKEIDADLVMATDPDADRVGIAIQDAKGQFMLLNGNQTGALLIYYLLNAWEKHGKIDGNQYIVKTIVTSYLLDKIADSKNVECYNTLTGFKHIAQCMSDLEGQKTFIGGGEESYGYLVGDIVRDKDAVVAAAIIAEMTAYYKDQGSSLYETLLAMYVEYGCYQEKLVSFTKKGKRGAEEIQEMMASFRKNPPTALAGEEVITIKDYQEGKAHHVGTGSSEQLDFPKSNVLQFVTDNGSIISARPSGTEPKIKFYVSVNSPLEHTSQYEETKNNLLKRIDQLIADLNI
ncbi:MAG: phospho-sugar mutase [Saprospiraceae bacterium]|nr:phospho-sugar mutase [Saprospiraceae bacterium]